MLNARILSTFPQYLRFPLAMDESFERLFLDDDFPPPDHGLQPYQYEPTLPPDEIERRRMARAAARAVVETPPGRANLEPTNRLLDTSWCRCGNCQPMPTAEACTCCFDVPNVGDLFETDAPSVCVTTHPDFEPHLNRGVLTTFFRASKKNWKRRPKARGQGGSLTNE